VKTKEWKKIRRKLKLEFLRRGITECELKYEGCWKDNALSFAHLDKRQHLKGDELKEVVLACTPCHQKVEYIGREKMREVLTKVINSRLKNEL
jgi:hypothetical protein